MFKLLNLVYFTKMVSFGYLNFNNFDSNIIEILLTLFKILENCYFPFQTFKFVLEKYHLTLNLFQFKI